MEQNNWNKIAHLAQIGTFWGKFHINSLSTFSALSCYTIWKKKKNSKSRSWDIGLHNFWPQLSQKCIFGPNKEFSGNFTSYIFIYLSCCTVVSSLGRNGPFGQKSILRKFHLNGFHIFMVPYHAENHEI